MRASERESAGTVIATANLVFNQAITANTHYYVEENAKLLDAKDVKPYIVNMYASALSSESAPTLSQITDQMVAPILPGRTTTPIKDASYQSSGMLDLSATRYLQVNIIQESTSFKLALALSDKTTGVVTGTAVISQTIESNTRAKVLHMHKVNSTTARIIYSYASGNAAYVVRCLLVTIAGEVITATPQTVVSGTIADIPIVLGASASGEHLFYPASVGSNTVNRFNVLLNTITPLASTGTNPAVPQVCVDGSYVIMRGTASSHNFYVHNLAGTTTTPLTFAGLTDSISMFMLSPLRVLCCGNNGSLQLVTFASNYASISSVVTLSVSAYSNLLESNNLRLINLVNLGKGNYVGMFGGLSVNSSAANEFSITFTLNPTTFAVVAEPSPVADLPTRLLSVLYYAKAVAYTEISTKVIDFWNDYLTCVLVGNSTKVSATFVRFKLSVYASDCRPVYFGKAVTTAIANAQATFALSTNVVKDFYGLAVGELFENIVGLGSGYAARLNYRTDTTGMVVNNSDTIPSLLTNNNALNISKIGLQAPQVQYNSRGSVAVTSFSAVGTVSVCAVTPVGAYQCKLPVSASGKCSTVEVAYDGFLVLVTWPDNETSTKARVNYNIVNY